MYDAASNVLQQRLSQLNGVGDVNIGGATLPAVRVELNPQALYNYGIGLEDVRAALASANANSPKGTIERRRPALSDLHQRPGQRRRRLRAAGDRLPQRRGGAPAPTSPRSSTRSKICATSACRQGQPSVLVILYRQPGANIIDTVDAVKAELPHLEAAMPADMNVSVAIDRTHDDPRLAARHRADAGDRGAAGDRRGVSVPAQRSRHASSRASRCRSRSSARSA